jgi:hypothetical protein
VQRAVNERESRALTPLECHLTTTHGAVARLAFGGQPHEPRAQVPGIIDEFHEPLEACTMRAAFDICYTRAAFDEAVNEMRAVIEHDPLSAYALRFTPS